MNHSVKVIALSALFFYALCWFTHQQTGALHYLGIALPWLSLLLSIPIAYFCKAKDGNYFTTWGYVYATATVLYVVAVSLMSGSIWHQLPHLAACALFIAYFSLERHSKQQ